MNHHMDVVTVSEITMKRPSPDRPPSTPRMPPKIAIVAIITANQAMPRP